MLPADRGIPAGLHTESPSLYFAKLTFSEIVCFAFYYTMLFPACQTDGTLGSLRVPQCKQTMPSAHAAQPDMVCFLAIDGQRHTMVCVPFTANGNGIRQNILRKCHTGHAGITDVVQVRPGHLAP